MRASKLIASLGLVAAIVGVEVLVMTQGWGLTPRSWWWIVGVGIFGQTAVKALLQHVSKEPDK